VNDLHAELVPFSPLDDEQLPEGTNGVIIGGGYPELHLSQLHQNQSMMRSVAEFGRAGGVVYAECGGLMYLSQFIRPLPGDEDPTADTWRKEWPMVGLLPFGTAMTKAMKMGYMNVELQNSSTHSSEGGGCIFSDLTKTNDDSGGLSKHIRGQLYHFSEIVDGSADDTKISGGGSSPANSTTAYSVWRAGIGDGSDSTREGYSPAGMPNVLASYVHLHFRSQPDRAFARRFLNACKTSGVQHRHYSSTSGVQHRHYSSKPAREGLAICSFVPAATEMLYELGLGAQLIGKTDFCPTPSPDDISLSQHLEVYPVVEVSSSVLDCSALSSVEMEHAIKSRIDAGQPLFVIDEIFLRESQPGLVIVQDSCEVCAPTMEAEDAAVAGVGASLRRAGLNLRGDDGEDRDRDRARADGPHDQVRRTQVTAVSPRTVDDIFSCMGRVGRSAGQNPVDTAAAVARVRQRLNRVAASLNLDEERPKVLSLEGITPDWAVLGGHWLPDIKILAGGVDVFAAAELNSSTDNDNGTRAPIGTPGCSACRVSWEELEHGIGQQRVKSASENKAHSEAGPLGQADVLLLTPCSSSSERTMIEATELLLARCFPDGEAVLEGAYYRAVRDGRTYVADHGAFSMGGPSSVVGAVELLASILHPERVPWGLQSAIKHGNVPAGSAWRLVAVNRGERAASAAGSIVIEMSSPGSATQAVVTPFGTGGRGLVFEQMRE
jgi:hypothetical protein